MTWRPLWIWCIYIHYSCMSDNCTGLARSKVSALPVMCASLAVLSSPRRVSFSSTEIIVSGECSVQDPVPLVCLSGLSFCTLFMVNDCRLSLLLFVCKGFYCPEGTEQPLACPANTIKQTPGGSDVHDCLVCPPSYWCKKGKSGCTLCCISICQTVNKMCQYCNQRLFQSQ